MADRAPSSSRIPVAPWLMPEDLPPVVERRDSDPFIPINDADWKFQNEQRERQQVEARAACGGLPDEPDDGGARGVAGKPYRF